MSSNPSKLQLLQKRGKQALFNLRIRSAQTYFVSAPLPTLTKGLTSLGVTPDQVKAGAAQTCRTVRTVCDPIEKAARQSQMLSYQQPYRPVYQPPASTWYPPAPPQMNPADFATAVRAALDS